MKSFPHKVGNNPAKHRFGELRPASRFSPSFQLFNILVIREFIAKDIDIQVENYAVATGLHVGSCFRCGEKNERLLEFVGFFLKNSICIYRKFIIRSICFVMMFVWRDLGLNVLITSYKIVLTNCFSTC
jgi:hypothetical protein